MFKAFLRFIDSFSPSAAQERAMLQYAVYTKAREMEAEAREIERKAQHEEAEAMQCRAAAMQIIITAKSRLPSRNVH